MELQQTSIDGVVLLQPRRFRDERGWFSETWNEIEMTRLGIKCRWVQDNHSYSSSKGTLRGLHYQLPPRAQDKLVRCSRGAIMDVAVDVRKGSPSFGKSVAVELTAENGLQLFMPKGFLHGFVTLCDDCEIQYKCSDFYAPESDRSVRWNDPELQISWGQVVEPILSRKDENAALLRDSPLPFVYGVSS